MYMANSDCKTAPLWIAAGDIHDATANFARIPEMDEASGIIISGDLTNNGGIDKYSRILASIQSSHLPILAQIGNMDLPAVDGWLGEKGINLHCQCRELAPGVAIIGIGGSTPTPMNTPAEFGEDAYAAWLDALWQKACKYPHIVLVSHNPPKDTPADRINDDLHVGSVAVRRFIEEKQPDVCICGHIHEGRSIFKMDATTVVNPGPLAEGGYVALRIVKDTPVAELCELAV